MNRFRRLGIALCGIVSSLSGYVTYNNIAFSKEFVELDDARSFASSQKAGCNSQIANQLTSIDQSKIEQFRDGPDPNSNLKSGEVAKFDQHKSFDAIKFLVKVNCSENTALDVCKAVFTALSSSLIALFILIWVMQGFSNKKE
jgi:hypothetical protein